MNSLQTLPTVVSISNSQSINRMEPFALNTLITSGLIRFTENSCWKSCAH